MTLTRLTALTSRWWTVPVAAIVFLAIGISFLSIGYSFLPLAPSTLFACGAFALSRRRPLIALAAAMISAPLAVLGISAWSSTFVVPLLIAGLAASIAIYELEPMSWRLYAGGAVTAVTLIAGMTRVTLEADRDSRYIVAGSFGYLALGVLTWAVPFGLRAFRDALRAEQDRSAVQARTLVVESELRDERLRADITHDFHDVMAHSLAVLAAQAEGLRLTHTQHPERIEPVLTTISDTARLALVEVRQLLERVDDDARRPQPTIEDIPALIDQTRSAGPTVTFHDAGRHGALPRIGGIAAYRIVQEGLTNALRHGGPDVDVVVTMSWTGPGLSLAVSSPIRDRDALGPVGRGVTGMHERAKQAGGWVDVDADGERFVVTAYLPYKPEAFGSTTLGEETPLALPVIAPNQTAERTPPARPASWDVQEAPIHSTPATPTMPPPTATWSETNARRVQLDTPGGLSEPTATDPARPASQPPAGDGNA